MSPQPHQPITRDSASRVGPQDEPCRGDSCPSPAQWKSLKEKVDDIHGVLLGDIEKDTPGVLERVRNLEKSEKSRRYWSRTALGVFVTGFCVWVWDRITGKSG